MSEDSPHLIELDDRPSWFARLAIIGLVVLMLGLSVFVGGRMVESDDLDASAGPTVTMTPDVCARWTVPDLLEPAIELAYPSWRWICRLANPE